jgi:hypothetical protein
MSEVLEAADERSLTIVVVSSLKDVAGLLQREEALFVRKVKEVVIQGGVKPFDEAEPGALLEPDTAHNNEFDHEASAFFYRRCQELNVPLIIVSRFCAYQCQMPRKIYDDMAATGSSIGKHLKDSQASSIEQLWKRANAEGVARTGLPPRCDRTWFCDTFCGGEGKERDGSEPIWDLIVAFNMYTRTRGWAEAMAKARQGQIGSGTWGWGWAWGGRLGRRVPHTCITCICMHVHMHVRMHVHLHMHACVHVHAHVHVHMHMHAGTIRSRWSRRCHSWRANTLSLRR